MELYFKPYACHCTGSQSEFKGTVTFRSTQQQGNGFTTGYAKSEKGSGSPLYLPLTSGEWEFKFTANEDSKLLLVSTPHYGKYQ